MPPIGNDDSPAALKARIEALDKELERLRARAEALELAGNVGSWELDPATGKGSWSPKMFELYYLEPSDEAPSLDMAASLVHPDDQPRIQQNLGALLQTGTAPPVVFRTHPDIGPRRYLRAAVTRAGEGAESVIFGAVDDVTQLTQVEGELADHASTLEAIYANSPFFIMAIELDGTISFVNRVAEPLEEAAVVGKHHLELVSEGDRDAVSVAVERVMTDGVRAQVTLHGRDGRVWEARYVPVQGPGGAVRQVLSFAADVTEQRRREAQMHHAQKLESLGVLAGGIAHDFNNLLVAILGNAELALEDSPGDSPARESLDEIVVSSKRAADLCRQMLAYSGKGKFIVEVVSLPQVVTEMLQLLEASISKGAELHHEFEEGTGPIEADVTQIRQVVMNLVLNASDALGGADGDIRVVTGTVICDAGCLAQGHLDDTLSPGRYSYLTVSDSGAGMDDETRERMFEPFFSSKEEGRGLGLSAVLGIVRSHGGAVQVESEPGQGTSIRVLLPTTDKDFPRRERRGPARAPSDLGPSRGTILVVDDEPAVRNLAARALNRAGFDVLIAKDGREAVECFAARREGIAVVLLDVTMPRMDGEAAFAELRELDPDVRVLLMSGFDEQEATSRFAGRGLAGFLQKPYGPAELVDAVQRLLDD